MSQPLPTKRMLVGAGTFSDAGPALDIADRLATTMVSDIGGLLLQDHRLLETCASVSGRVVSPRGDLGAMPTPDKLRHLLESDAKAFRTRLRHLAEVHRKQWTFERRIGETIGGLCAAAANWDWLLIGQARIGSHSGRVVAVASGDTGGGEVQDLARALSASMQTRTAWLDPAMPDTDIVARINAISAAVVLVDAAHGAVRTVDQIRDIYQAARCPVLVLASSSIRPQIPHSTHMPPTPDND